MEKIPARHGAPWDSLENNVTDINVSSIHAMLFLNDLESVLCDKCCNGVIFEFQYDDITVLLV